MPPWTLPAKFDMSGVIRMVIDRRWRSSSPLEPAGSAGGGQFDLMVTSPPDALTTADHHTRWPRLQPRMRTRSERHAKSTVGRHGDLQGPSFPKGQGGGKAPGDVDRDPHEVSPLTTTAGRDTLCVHLRRQQVVGRAAVRCRVGW